MNTGQTETLATVDPKHLESAYLRCAHLFNNIGMDQTVSPAEILGALEQAHPLLSRDEIVDLFRRLCLTVQLVADIDANLEDAGLAGSDLNILPSGLYQLASSETAFEQMEEGYACTFFARDVLEDAFSILRPN